MDDLLALDGGGAATKWQKQHAARKRAILAKQHRAEARIAKKAALAAAKTDLKARKAKWLKGWKRKAAAAKDAGLPRPSKKGRPWRLGLENSQVIDMTGWTFGRLTVIRSAPVSLTMKTAQRCRVWVVKCSCGSPERLVNGTTLRQGNSKSCGCLVRERMRESWQSGRLAERQKERERLKKAPLSVRVDLLRSKILHGERITRTDARLLSAVRKELVELEVQSGIRRRHKSGRPMLVRPAGIKAVRGSHCKKRTIH